MKETASKGFQILSDGQRVWVNSLTGASVARLGIFGRQVMIDIHLDIDEQRATGKECLDCRHDLEPAEAWQYFVLSLQRNYNVTIDEKHRPDWAK